MRLFPTYLALPFLLALLCCACQPAAAPSTEAPFPYQEASIAELQARMSAGELDSTTLTEAYLARIAALDRAGPGLHAVIELNPDARREAAQRDTERQLGVEKAAELEADPAGEVDRLAAIWEGRGLSVTTARTVAEELSEKDAVGAHLTAEHNIDPNDLTSPWAAALSSLVSFVVGSALPFLTMLAFPPSSRILATIIAVMAALALTGWVSAWLGEAPRTRAVVRLMAGGALALALTYGIGHVFGVSA